MKNRKTSIGSLVGYLAIVLLMIIIGAIAIIQVGMLGKNVDYLTKDATAKLKKASELEPLLLNMKTTLERSVRSRGADSTEAEQINAIVNRALEKAEEEIGALDESILYLDEIKLLTDEYIMKYRDIVNAITRREMNQSSIISIGEDISKSLEELSEKHQEGDLSDQITRVQDGFLEATVDVGEFFATSDPQYASRAENKIADILEDFSAYEVEELQDIMYYIEDDYLDTFLAVSAVNNKMTHFIEQDFFPLGNQIMLLAERMSYSAWTDMETTLWAAKTRVGSTIKSIMLLTAVAGLLGMLIGFISSNRIAKGENKNVMDSSSHLNVNEYQEDVLDKLERLSKLKGNGFLTEDEFTTLKQKIVR